MEYTIVSRNGENEFVQAINEHIEDGWQPQGGVSMVLWTHPEYPDEFIFAQAMVRIEDDED